MICFRSLWFFDSATRSQCVRREEGVCDNGQLYIDNYMAWINTVEGTVEDMCVRGQCI